ncbi:MAG: 23S rRNA (adenine(2030)-N(6))-methyltransferase RlmJ [Hyphomonadaceae bacterium]|nr:23S rRNA (adenine(2030)-N(6))-methyltransferase RlmJ [Hyphomonadaceae bacterium]
MNYRHAFHAGNFADVVKHIAMALCFDRLNSKEAPYRYIDTHAGIGLYDFASDESGRSPEWKNGIGRIWEAEPGAPENVRAALAPWMSVIRRLNADSLQHYPGSPVLAAEMMRKGDALRLCELHPPSAELLRQAMGRDKRVKIEERDGFDALPAYLPPPERRGLVLIDPPFEVGTSERKKDFDWMLTAAAKAVKRWPLGVYVFWRPIKDPDAVVAFDSELASMLIEQGGIPAEKLLVADLWVRAIGPGSLAGAGVVIVNPPFGVAENLRTALPWLCDLMKQGDGAGWRVETAAEA